MTALIILVAIIYVAMTIVVAFSGASSWSIARGMQRDYEEDAPRYLGDDFIERQRAKYEQEALAGARLFANSPLWPFLALNALARILSDSKRDATPGEHDTNEADR